MQIPLIGKSDQGQYPVNLFYDPEQSDQRPALRGIPGLKSFYASGVGAPVRAMTVFNGSLYAVIGNTVYKINTAGIATVLTATLSTSTGVVEMADNGTQIMLIDGTYGYIIEGDVLAQITDDNFPVPASLAYQDTYFIVTEKDTGKIYISSQMDGTEWDALDYASAEGKPDDALAIISDHRELWILGQVSTEVFYNSGDAAFPFERINGAFIEKGIGAAASAAKLDNSVFWLTEEFQVVRALEYTPVIVSTRKIEKEIAGYETKSDAVAYTYAQEGHSFYVLNFPTANKTWVYDVATQLWHERRSFPTDGRHRGNCYAYFNGKHLVGDYDNGKIYELDFNTFDDDGKIQRSIHVFPPIMAGNRQNVFHFRIEIEVTSGVGLVSGQGEDPIAILDWSNDNYNNWSNEHWLKIGKIGEYTNRVVERRMGSARWRAYRLTITDPVERCIIAPYLDAESGSY